MYTKIPVFILLCLVLIKQIKSLKEVVVATKKSPLEKVSIVVGVCILLVITYLYAKTILDYAIAVVGIATFLGLVFKQGITRDGFTMTERGKEMHSWSEVGHVKIEQPNDLRITFFSKIGSPMVKQRYDIQDKDKILEILQNNTKILE